MVVRRTKKESIIPTCIECGVKLVVGKNWYEGYKKQSYYLCKYCTKEKLKPYSNERKEYNKKYYQKHRKEMDKSSRASFRRLIQKIIDLLGGKEFRRFSSSYRYYKHILRGILADSKEYQLLCANCNWIKRYEKRELYRG